MNQNPAPSVSTLSLFERSLTDAGIPPCPALLNQITTMMQQEEADFGRLAKVISSDVGLSAALINTCNSPFYGAHRNNVGTVSDALMTLGLQTACNTVAGIILRHTFPHSPGLERFWDESARTARLSGWLTQHLHIPGLSPDVAYTYGLFRDCGIPVLFCMFRDYPGVLAKANRESERCFTEIEQESLEINHTEVGSMLAKNWGLPDDIHQSIAYHHNLGVLEQDQVNLSTASKMLIAIALLAEHLGQRQLGLGKSMEWTKFGSASLNLLGVNEEDLERLYSEAVPIIYSTE